MSHNLNLRVISIAIIFAILISLMVAANIVSAANDNIKVNSSQIRIENTNNQKEYPSSLGSSASGYCSSFGGSTLYESISSVTCTQNADGTMTIKVDINIANPTSCTYGKPCPEYDDSPEYVNVWIDWNGDNQFESNEKVIDAALTGYSNLNYHGTLTTSKIVTIPPNAVSSTWMRVNLGWDYDPDEPCTYSWRWGDVVDKEVELTNIKVVQLDSLNDIDIEGISDPVWKKYFDTNGNLIDIVTKEDYSIADDMTSGGFKIKATLDAFPNKPLWNPNVDCEWKILNSPAAGDCCFAGWSGTFDVAVPQKVGVYTLQLKFTIRDDANNIIGIQTINKKLYVTYGKPEIKPPKKIWLEKATSWAAGAGTPAEITSELTKGIYSKSGWSYKDNNNPYQALLLVDDLVKEGNCVSFSVVWNILNKVLGVGETTVSENTQTFGNYHKGFVTKPATALDGQKGNAHPPGGSIDRWRFSMHTMGEYKSKYYDPTFNGIYAGKNDFIDWHQKTDFVPAYKIAIAELSDNYAIIELPCDPKKYPWGNYEYSKTLATLANSENNGAKFTGNHFESGIDTDGDGLLNYLSTNVEVDVNTTGNYSIFSSLKFGNNTITSRSSKYSASFVDYYLSSDVGLRNITLNFSGQDIYDSGIDGNYTLDLIMLDDNGTVIDNKSFNTSAYDHTSFGEIPAKIENATDTGEDTDGDGLLNYLSADISIKAINPSKYSLQGVLYSNGTIIATNYTSVDLISGINIEKLRFSGSDVWKSKFNGPYTLEVSLYDKNIQQIDDKEYKTSYYDSEKFQHSSGYFQNIYSDYGMDTDSDGLYNFLATKADVNIEVPGNYTIFGWLSDSKGDITWDNNELYLDAGNQSVQLNFSGTDIYKHGTNGPYEISSISLFDNNNNLVDSENAIYNTSAYKYTDFQKPEDLLVNLTGKYNDYGTDTDGDGLYDNLTVDVEVIPANSGNVVASARLMDSSGEEIIWASNTTNMKANQPQNIQLNFDGRYIYGDLTNGPYYVKDVYVYHTGDPNLSDYVEDAHTTAAYNYSEFEKSGIITGKVMDSGLPVQNAFISVDGGDSDYTNSAGRYNLVMLQNKTYTVNIEKSGYNSWKIFVNDVYVKDGNSVDVNATIGEAIYVNFTQGNIDTEPPSSITDIQSINGTNWINWTWTNPSDLDFDHTEIYLNGSFQNTTSAEFFNATGLQPETDYTISTRTVDNAGNVNQTWVNLTATTGKEFMPIMPVANFSSNVSEGFAPLSVQFTDLSENAAGIIWDFGDGIIDSVNRTPVHVYTTSKNYTVNLTASNQNGTASKQATITVLEKPAPVLPVANFSANVSDGYVTLTVQFTDLSENATSWSWDFGDGNNSIERDPIHTYFAAGSYIVNLTASNENGTASMLTTITVREQPVVLPDANFTSDVTEGSVPLTVQFTDLSKNATCWNWNLGDGVNSIEQNPMHTYNTTGTYTVTLTVSNVAGTDFETKTGYIIVKPVSSKLIAAFCACPTSGEAPLRVMFTDNSTGSPKSWKWSFGDGAYSTEKNPVHTYSVAGKYTVSLTVKNAKGSSSITKYSYIKVKNTLKSPVAAFSASPNSGNVPLKVVFTDKSKGYPTSWKWNFGDGSYSTEKNPVYIYSKVGKYTVSLTVKNSAGKSTVTGFDYIKVTDALKAPTAAFSGKPTAGKVPLEVQFTDKSTGSPTAWKWSFGDGKSSTARNPVHKYTKAGKYTVKLTVKNAKGTSSATKSGYISVK